MGDVSRTPLYDKDGDFIWTKERSDAAILLAQGYSKAEIEEQVGVNRSTIWRWENEEGFSKELDRLSNMYGASSKAYRNRMLSQAIRQKIKENGEIDLSGVSFVDLIKEARMNAEGLKLGIINEIAATVNEETRSMAGSGSVGVPELPEPEQDEAD